MVPAFAAGLLCGLLLATTLLHLCWRQPLQRILAGRLRPVDVRTLLRHGVRFRQVTLPDDETTGQPPRLDNVPE